MKEKGIAIRKLVYSALCLAIAMVLPFLTGQIPQIGKALCPMHLPVFLCGFFCGAPWGAVVGFVVPFLRFALFHAPTIMPSGIGMAFELASYGFLSGLFYRLFPSKIGYIYVSLICSMLGGRVVWGAVRFLLAGLNHSSFPFSAFLAGAFSEAIPGIIVQIILIPILVFSLKKAKLLLNE